MLTMLPGCRAHTLVTVLGLVGEYPIRSLSLLGNDASLYKTIHQLCQPHDIRNPFTNERIHTKLFVISGKGQYKTLRLYKGALPILHWIHPAAYDHYMGITYQHTFSGNVEHVDRNHRVAETVAMMRLAGIEAAAYLLPNLQNKKLQLTVTGEPAFYSARELKRVDISEQNKTMFTRATGCILSTESCFAIYNTRNAVMKWSGRGEWKAKASILQIARMNANVTICNNAILFGVNEDIAYKTLEASFNAQRKDNRISSVYDHIHFIPMDAIGARLLRLMVLPDRNERLMSALFPSECRSHNRGYMEYDALIDGTYIYSHLESDLARLVRFYDAIAATPGNYIVLCFPHQVSFLRSILGDRVELRTIELSHIEEALHMEGGSPTG